MKPFLACVVLLAAFDQGGSIAPQRPPGAWRQYASPVAGGFDAEALAAARGYAERSGSGAVLLVQHGRVVFAWGDPSRPYTLRSIRKSLLDLMFGAPFAAGKVRLDATLADLKIDDRESLSVGERSATVAQLLSARSGVYHPAAREPQSMTRNRPKRGSTGPGEAWFYNNWDFNALGTIFEQHVGQDLFQAFRRALVTPLGMEDYRARDSYPIREPTRSRHAAYEFGLSARDLARVGQLVLQEGVWEGTEVVSPAWLRESLTIRTPFPQGGGYSYLWWIDASRFRTDGKPLRILDSVYDIAATGLGEQLLLIVPSLHLVFVHLTSRGEGEPELEGSAFELAEMVLQARRGDPSANATFAALTPEPFPNAPPLTPDRDATPLSPNAADVAGEYEVSPTLKATIRAIDGGLFIDMPGRGEAEMFQEAPDRFFLKVADVTLAFERDAAGAVVGIRVVERGRPLTAKRLP